jgi:hypothetical protein
LGNHYVIWNSCGTRNGDFTIPILIIDKENKLCQSKC